MKQLKVSNNVIRRLPRYLRKLDELKTAGVDRISSGELGRQMSLTSSQIRQDFSCFGEFGQQGYGYNVTGLRGEIASILGMNRDFSVILVGVGNIGRALIENFCFEQYGFHMLAAYDVRPELIGTDISGIRIHDISELPHIFDNNKVDMAVLSVPKLMANKAAHELVEHGVHAIWNFTNVELDVAESDVIVENIHFSDSLLALIGQAISPIFKPLGFADWRVTTSLISGFTAKEAVVSTMAVLMNTSTANLGTALSGAFSTLSALSFLVFTLLYTPCVAAVATIKRELDSRIQTVGVVIMQCMVAWLCGCAVYQIGALL